jgi:hypothetical protein|tara:strand:+ start:192 stop:380 length:189 start_codon:yes stop_codon:yes gene_type:complete
MGWHLDVLHCDVEDLTVEDLHFYIRDLEEHVRDFKMLRNWRNVRECEAELRLMQARLGNLSR